MELDLQMGKLLTKARDEVSSTEAAEDKTRRSLLLVALWFGLLTGLLEVAIIAVRRLFWGKIFLVSQHFVWMAPLADVIFFLLPVALLLAVDWAWHGIGRTRLTIFLGALFACLNLLFMLPRLHDYAVTLLALGFAVQITRLITRRLAVFHSVVRHTAIWMVGLVVMLAAAVQGWSMSAEWQALAKLPTAPTGAPNVLLIILDTVRAQNLSLYGYSRPTTPHLAHLAQNGVVFERALATAPWTLPSHVSMFTGRFPHELASNWETPLDTTFPTLAEFLNAHGYLTAGFVANTRYCSYEYGLNRGFTHYEDYRVSWGQIAASSTLVRTIANNARLRWFLRNDELLNRQFGSQITQDFLRWLSRKGQRPFFAFLNYFDAHTPYLPPSPFDRKFGQGRAHGKISPIHRLWSTHGQLSPQRLQEEIDAYDGAVAYLDHELGVLFNELENRGVLQNTLVIITSDHGEEFGEHGFYVHGNSLYLSELHVPLVMTFPARVPAGTVVGEPVSLRYLPITVIDLLNLAGDGQFPGHSLAQYWEAANGSAARESEILLSEVDFARNLADRYPLSQGDMKSLVVDSLHYIKNGDGREELYNFSNDTDEQQDLANSEAGQRLIPRLRLFLDKTLALKGASN